MSDTWGHAARWGSAKRHMKEASDRRRRSWERTLLHRVLYGHDSDNIVWPTKNRHVVDYWSFW